MVWSFISNVQLIHSDKFKENPVLQKFKFYFSYISKPFLHSVIYFGPSAIDRINSRRWQVNYWHALLLYNKHSSEFCLCDRTSFEVNTFAKNASWIFSARAGIIASQTSKKYFYIIRSLVNLNSINVKFLALSVQCSVILFEGGHALFFSNGLFWNYLEVRGSLDSVDYI